MQTQNVDPDSFPVARCSGFSCRFLCIFLLLRYVVELMLICVLSLCCGGVAADVRYDFALLPLYGGRLVTVTSALQADSVSAAALVLGRTHGALTAHGGVETCGSLHHQRRARRSFRCGGAVSYTHLTLPTIYSV